MSLSSLIVQREVATMRQVEEALARQVIYGGDFATNLLEVAPIDEAALTQVLGETVGLGPAPAGELPVPDGRVQLVPPEMALQRDIVPLSVTKETLVLAVAQPLPREVEEQLSFALGVSVEQRAASSVRVRQAITRLYGLPLEARMQRLLSRMAGASPPAPSAALFAHGPPPPESAEPARAVGSLGHHRTPPLGSPIARPRASPFPGPPVRRHTSTSFPAITQDALDRVLPARRPHGQPANDPLARNTPVVPQRRASFFQRDASLHVRVSRRRRGPVTLDSAKREAEEASDRDTLICLFFDFARQYFEYAALFLVHGDIAEGFDASGAGASRERIVGIGVPLDLPSLLASAREERVPMIARPSSDGLEAVLLSDLERPGSAEVAIVPLVVRTRTVAILMGDCAEAGIDRASVDEVKACGALVGRALERIIVRRKLEGFIATGKPAGAMAEEEVPPTMPDVSSAPTARSSSERPDEARPDEDRTEERAEPEPPVAPAPQAPTASQFPQSSAKATLVSVVSATSMPPPPPNVALVRRISGPPIPREDDPDSVRSAVRPPIPVTQPDPSAGAAAPESTEGPSPSEAASSHDFASDGEIPQELDARALFDLLGWETGTEASEAAPASSAFAVPPHHPPPPSRAASSPELPSVIVDLEQELATMVDRIVAGQVDEGAEAELLRQGDRAMRVIMARFPGPVTFDRTRIAMSPAPPRASECGPLLRLVARERKVALPFVLNWMSDPDPDTRGWATHLVCELAYAEAIPHVIERLRDSDPCTRASAKLAIVAISKVSPEPVRDAVATLAGSNDAADRLAAMGAMTSLRQASLAAEMMTALDDSDEEVAAAAHEALVRTTAQDFGPDARLWQKWWEQNASRHRIEWLVDSLTHEDPELRHRAGEDLRKVTHEYFGYASDLPLRDRERAQQRYRDWWVTEGRSRFRRR